MCEEKKIAKNSNLDNYERKAFHLIEHFILTPNIPQQKIPKNYYYKMEKTGF